ncbi:Lrp/AsnC family transcriptional regulator [Paraglaciecola sp. MB-3u-78]|jgi:Lrp/AsnC family leucine-responsive transcriptional regulator|uniref:Lrp/AsnC family transcriptional regulator n=1 Tax=Paraglaciecola sp. MB-3u-78 TaxID=2058332 RepID=UPI000C34DAC3|nr:Lrp/AsnC family transcriptional regulator [Paraglaciecola sp. MB-3u-78]PKG97321.1 AsnC family transcriptional regulator [Paraglaciecola sp. MB-3u-78]
MKIDKTDLAILNILQKEGRVPIAELASRIHLTTSPCSDRVKRLEKLGIIESYQACLSVEKLGLPLVIFIHVSLNQTSKSIFKQFAEVTNNMSEIEECYSVTGDFDVTLKIRMKDILQFQEFMATKFLELPGIVRSRSEVLIKQFKKTSGVSLEGADCS